MRLETGVITSEFQDYILDLTLLIVSPFLDPQKRLLVTRMRR